MSETLISSTSISAGGGTASGTCGKAAESDTITLDVTGFDGNSTNLDFAATGASTDTNGTVRTLGHTGSSVTGVDASVDGAVVILDGLVGVEQVEVTVTNNAASSTTVTVEEDTAY